MNATKLTMIVFSAAAIIISGCSNDNRITGPDNAVIPEIDNDQSESTTPPETENNAARIAVRGDESAVDRLSIVAEVLRTEVEGGCWYLTAESGDNYTPITPKSLSLELGMILKAKGYIDKNIHFFCGNGPAFVIEQYEIVSEPNWPSEDRDLKHELSLSDTPSKDRAPKSVEKKYIEEKYTERQTLQAATEDRAPKNENTSQISNSPSEDRAPEYVEKKYIEKKMTEKQTLQAATEDRAPKNENTSQISNSPSEDRAPKSIEKKYIEKKYTERQTLQAATEDRAPKNENTSQISNSPSEDRAPKSIEKKYIEKKLTEKQTLKVATEDRAPWFSSENRAPQKYEAMKEDVKLDFVVGKPVPIISEDMQFNSNSAVNGLEGYVEKTKEGCLLLETAQKEVFELHHDMDVMLETGTYIRVTGYFSALLSISCSGAPVFYAERLTILSYPKEREYPKNDAYAPSEDAFAPKVIEAEGTMHPTVPEGMCWYFETDDKERYELIFSDPINLSSGMRLKVKAIATDLATFCQSGKALEVIGWETVNENKF